MALGSIFVGWFLAKRALSGVDDVRRTARSIAQGAFGSRVPVKGTGDEVDELAVTFNEMLARIETVLRSMEQITENIAHDLRSPVARMRGVAEMALLGRGSIGDYETATGRVVEECDRLLAIINTMLDISEAEAGTARLTPVQIDAGEMVRGVIGLFEPVAEDKNVAVDLHVAGTPVLRADAQKLQRVLSNLLDNAIKYTPAGGSIIISVGEADRTVSISVSDTGPGIPASELGHIFDRFYRGEKSRTEPGSGLGLSLAGAFVRAHNGSITVKSEPGKGAQFVVTLPKAGC